MTKKQAKEIVELLSSIDIEVWDKDIIDIEDVDELKEFLEDNQYFNVEVIYYYEAMKYLAENDNSLHRSLSIADELGYEVKNLNSEVLASLLASEIIREDFEDIEAEIDEILNP